jgi:hypothetical protein
MKIFCHFCKKVTADIRDASIARGTVMVCPACVGLLPTKHRQETKQAPMPDFLSGLFGGSRGRP